MNNAVLPPIPFGAAAAACFDSEATCGDFMARFPDAPSRFGAIGPATAFRARLRNVPLPDVSLVAGACSPKATTHLGTRAALVIPFGRSETVLRTARNEFHWAAPHHAFFIPAGAEIAAESTAGAFLRLDIVESALVRTAATMTGSAGGPATTLDLRTARTIPLQPQGTNWLPVVRSLCGTVDALDCDAGRLAAAGLDDVVLRTVVMMLRPELAAGAVEAGRAQGFDLEPVLEAIVANLTGRVTLADMARWSGRSARTLQLAFQKRFGIGPMQWLRERRLDLVRQRLLVSRDGETIREVAAACGIHRLATLIPEYTRRFGEKPSETLLRSRR